MAEQQGGGRTYSEEDVMVLMNEAAKRGANEAIKHRIQSDNNEEDHDESVINPKIVKQLKDTVAVFTALKELSSNPLQQTIEETVGTMAASVIQNAFAPRGPPPKRDLLDTILNSQFAFGLGSGIGQRGPELIESMGRTFGSDRAGQMIDGMLNKYGGPPSRQLGPSGPSPGATNPGPQQQSNPSNSSNPPQDQKQSEKDLLLSLDPNNPEHVSAYAETQGGLPIEVARKMLMIHQDAFIEQMKKEGQNIDQISTVRGSRSAPAPPPKQTPTPPSKPEHISPISEPVSEPILEPQPEIISEPIYTNNVHTGPSSIPDSDMQYAEYQDINQKDKTQEIVQENQKMMKEFATDIGKIIGDALNKIENLNNTVFALQTELNDVKKQRLEQEQQILEQQISSAMSSMPTPFVPIVQPETQTQMPLYDQNANLQNTDDFINELNNPIIIDKDKDINNTDIVKDLNDKDIDNVTDVVKEDKIAEDKKIAEDQTKIPEQTDQIPEQTDQIPEQTDQIPEQTDQIPEQTDQIPEQTDQIPDNNLLNTEKGKDKFAHPITKNNLKKIAPSFKKDKDILDENNIDKNKDLDNKKKNEEAMNDNHTDEKNADEK